MAGYEEFERLVKAWEEDRNSRVRTVSWKITVSSAREKLAKPYPVIELDEPGKERLTNH